MLSRRWAHARSEEHALQEHGGGLHDHEEEWHLAVRCQSRQGHSDLPVHSRRRHRRWHSDGSPTLPLAFRFHLPVAGLPA